MPFYTISFTNLRYVPKEWVRVYLIRRWGRFDSPLVPTRELREEVKSGMLSRQMFLSYYEQQLESYSIYLLLRDFAEESRGQTVLLIDYQAKPEDGQRGVLAKKIKSLFPWVDMRGEWKK